MKNLIYIVPGSLCDVKKSSFAKLEHEGDGDYDILVHDGYHLIRENGLAGLVRFFEESLARLAYENIFIVSHSSGSDLILKANLKENIKAVIFWSPSMMIPQNISETLPKKDGLLCLTDTLCISEKLGLDFDQLDTRILLKKFTVPHVSFFGQNEPHDFEWGTIFTVPFEHEYTLNQMKFLLGWAKNWFLSNERSLLESTTEFAKIGKK